MSAGRPSVVTPEVVSILADCLRQGMSVREACAQSVISHEAYYYKLRSDQEFADKMYTAQQQTTIKAKQLLSQAIQGGDVAIAKWWLEHREPQDFSVGRKLKVDAEPEPEKSPLYDLTDTELLEQLKTTYDDILYTKGLKCEIVQDPTSPYPNS